MQREDLFTIGEFSAITGVGIYSLRYYDEIGALKPEYVDPVSNYRYYGYRQLSRIPAISICKDAGIKLSDFDAFLADGSVDYGKLLDAGRRSLEEIIDDCRTKEHGFDQIERFCSIRRTLCEGRDIIADIDSLNIWCMSCDESFTVYESYDLLVKLSENAGRHKVRINPSVHGLIKTDDRDGCRALAFSQMADTAGAASGETGRMIIPGGKYLFLPMETCSAELADKLITEKAAGMQTDHVMSLALLSDGDTGPLYCAAARLI